MKKPLLLQIVDALSSRYPYLQMRIDATGRQDLSPLQKCTAAIRILAYGSPADSIDEYVRICESTAVECLEAFVTGINEIFGDEYLRKPNNEDINHLLQLGEACGFSSMLGSIDCSNNDINVLNQSYVFNDVLQGQAPLVHFIVNGTQYNMGYYLADGIYPDWATFHTRRCRLELLFKLSCHTDNVVVLFELKFPLYHSQFLLCDFEDNMAILCGVLAFGFNLFVAHSVCNSFFI
ncbi:hypothetical protein VNO78_04073 [Psophocarpus tetragonolobus]|uniref:Uncharacterized protein n=1 Tax=Psophocarpus tetragonolobus TaxID=3891 RepID=A0AAN9XX96_PSOTE